MADEPSIQDLAEWLVVNGFAEEERGYGHATGSEIAKALLTDFDVKLKQVCYDDS